MVPAQYRNYYTATDLRNKVELENVLWTFNGFVELKINAVLK